MTQLVEPHSSFFGSNMVDLRDLRPGQVAMVGVPHDSTHNTRFGARFAPQGVREASEELARMMALAEELRDPVTGRGCSLSVAGGQLADVGDLQVYPTDVSALTASVRQGVHSICSKDAFPIVVGGDHYVTYPSFLGFADAVAERGGSRIGYIQLDGHLDFTDNNPVWGRYFHGSNARRVSEHEAVSGRNMVWIGLQGFVSTAVWWAIKDIGGTVFTYADVAQLGPQEVAKRACEIAMRDTDAVYVTVDIDVVDAGFSPGTGGVVFNAISPMDLLQMADIIASHSKVGAADVMEVAPNLDGTRRTVMFAAETMLRLAGDRILRRDG